ncbi:thiolase family protein [Burkholderia cepacia]|uniref:thiolase family protein n=1 Tax=Burkholderia cepacia TaxID=292 RepID=UPI00298F92C5|nr:hypothetical protein [Burkholderia cepacia]
MSGGQLRERTSRYRCSDLGVHANGHHCRKRGGTLGYSREQQDAFAVESQRKASRAQAEGRLDDELVPVITPDGTVVDRDLCLRPQTSLEGSLR